MLVARYNILMRLFSEFTALVFLLSACSSEVLYPTPTPTAWEGTLQALAPVSTVTQSPLLKTTGSRTSLPTASPSATPTLVPVTYKVTKNDDMFGIAFRFGISPQALMTANPTVNPRSMGIGTVLIIPVTPVPGGQPGSKGITPNPQASATPGLVSAVRAPDCYSAGDGGVWCFWLIQSGATQGVENVTGTINLAQPGGAALEQTAGTPLDIIPAGQALPIAAYFPAPVPTTLSATAKFTAVFPLAKDDGRYLPVEIRDQQVTLDVASGGAIITGRLSLAAGSKNASHVRLAATAFDRDGAVVGLRVWEAVGPLEGGSNLPFQIQVDSLGLPVNQVSLQAEARP